MSLRRNTLWNLVGMGAPLLVGVLAIPYLYQSLGTEKIGILTLVWALIGYFSLFDFGLGRALTQQVSTCIANGKIEQLPSLVKTGLVFTAAAGLLGGITLFALAYPLGFHWLGISSALQQSAVEALLIAAFGIPMTTVTTGLRGVLEAYEDFAHVNLLRMLLGLSNFGVPVVCVMLIGPSLAWMVLGIVTVRFIILIAHWTRTNTKLPQGWRKVIFSYVQLRQLFSFGAWMTVSNIVGPLMVTADRFLISAAMGASVVAYYTVPTEFLIRVLILPAALTSALFPRLAALMSTDIKLAKELYYKSIKVVTISLLPICILVAAASKLGLTIWLGQEFAEKSWGIVSVMAIGILLNGIAFVPFSAIQAAGKAKYTAYLHLVELFLYFPLLLILMHFFGLVGAAIAWTIRVTFDTIVMLVMANQEFK
jgi:O-antigen/teichoic acid export membrane protein